MSLSIGSAGAPEQIIRWTDLAPPAEIPALATAARNEGHDFLLRFEAEWSSGVFRFDEPGECLFVAEIGDRLVGLGGICRDPYQHDLSVGRLRHVYVAIGFRSRGIAERLVRSCLACTGSHFRIIRLKTINPVAARLYERIGFQPRLVDGERMTHCLSTTIALERRRAHE
jgi:ribosomal protein S18 acetylase RimI-like enzyme